MFNEAEVLHAKGRSSVALERYKQAFQLDPWAFHRYLEAYHVALELADSVQASRFLRAGVRHGLKLEWFTDEPGLMDFLANPAAADLNAHRKEDENAFGSFADSTFIKVLDSLLIEDQRYRMGTFEKPRMAQVDSMNFEFLIRYFQKNGFPDTRRLGHAISDLDVLLWHHRGEEYPDGAQWQRVLPFIRKAMAEGNLPPAFLTRYDDYSDHLAGRSMRYGALLNLFSSSPEELQFISKTQLNRNRAAVGWCPIEDAAFLAGVDLARAHFVP